MKTTSRIRNFARTSLRVVLLAGGAALAVTTSGCIVDDSGYNSGYGSCLPDLLVDWQIHNSAGASVTCGAAGAATVRADVNGSPFPQDCLAGESFGSIDVPLGGVGSYDITVSLFAADGTSLATPQQYSPPLVINNCYTNETPTPAVLVVSPASP
jgi:hypothetical protein